MPHTIYTRKTNFPLFPDRKILELADNIAIYYTV